MFLLTAVANIYGGHGIFENAFPIGGFYIRFLHTTPKTFVLC